MLVVEDDTRIRDFVTQGLRAGGHTVDTASTGPEGLGLLRTNSYDVAIVDVMLPELDGISMVRTARDRGTRTPVLILSARTAVEDRIRGLQEGADDYLTKPFSFAELEARLLALERRASSGGERIVQLQIGTLVLDRLSRRVSRDGTEIELQPKEYALLEYMMANPGRILSKSTLLDRVWGISFDPQTNVVDVLVSRLRAKVDRNFEPKLIHTRRGMGYLLEEPR